MSADIQLVTMPWDTLEMPSLALGVLQALLEREGLPAEVHYLNLAAMEHFGAGARPALTVDAYRQICRETDLGVGDWLFAVPPYRDPPPPAVDPTLQRIRTDWPGDGESVVARLQCVREMVPAFLERCVEDLLARSPRVVGFTSSVSQNIPSLVLAALLKARDPTLKIVFGGANCEGPMGLALLKGFPQIDVVVRGKAELILPGLARDLLAGRPIERRPGLCFREGGEVVAIPMAAEGIRMDDIPIPDYRAYFSQLGASSFRNEVMDSVAIPVESSRGCWWGAKQHCTFCGLNGDTMAFRMKSPDRFIREVIELVGRHKLTRLQAVDNILSMSYFHDVLPTLRDLDYDLSLFYEIKVNLKREEVRLLADAGVRNMQPGIESLSTPILRLMQKGTTALINIRFLKWCAEDGIQPFWGVLYGVPGEPPEEYDRMADTIASVTHLQPPTGFYPMRIDRFAPYHSRPERHGVELTGPTDHFSELYPVSPELQNDIACSFKHRTKDDQQPARYIGRAQEIVQRWRRRGTQHTLTYLRGPGFVRIVDRRFNLPSAIYTLQGAQARLYLACDAGATPEHLATTLRAEGTSLTPGAIRDFLDGLVEKRLIFQENSHYLALATRQRPSLGQASSVGQPAQPAR